MHKQVSGWTVNFGPNFPDQSLLWNTPPPPQKTSDLGWPKFSPEYPPHFGKLQIWDDQSLLWNTPPPPKENCQRVQVRDFLNTEIYYMWRLYQTGITTSLLILGNANSLTTYKCNRKPFQFWIRRVIVFTLKENINWSFLRQRHVLYLSICHIKY